jgi:CNT family concentrative nucleoside transporter
MPLLRLRSLVALILLVGVCWALSRDRKAIAWRVVLWGVALQVLFGMLVLLTPVGTTFFAGVNNVLLNVMHFAESGRSSSSGT